MDEPLPTQLAPAGEGAAPADWSQVTAPPPESPAAAFGAGWLIARSFSTWGRNVLRFALLGLVGNTPMAVGLYLLYARMPGLLAEPEPPSLKRLVAWMGTFGVAWLVTMLLYPLVMGAVMHGALRGLRGARAGVGEMLAAGGRAYLRVLGMGLLVGLAMIPATLLLVVPAIVLMVGWSAAVPAAVVEGAGPVRGLSRSWELTRGHRWRVFAGFLVVGLATAVVAGMAQAAATAVALVVGGVRGGMPGPAMAVPMSIYQLVAGALGTVTMVVCAAAYHGLRAAKEGGDPETLARVFE
jgi:hypothetical protein